MSFLAGQRIQRVELHVPRWGTAWARVATEADAVAEGAAVLTVGDLPMVGAVIPGRDGESAPSAWSGVWVNGAGWETVLPPRPAYQLDGGVRLLSVLGDLAEDCGKLALDLPPDARLGAHWARPRRRPTGRPVLGRHELDALAALRPKVLDPWWVDLDDRTRFGGRSSGPITASARLDPRDLTRGIRRLRLDGNARAFLPGGTFEGVMIERSIFRETSGDLSVELWSA